MPFPRHARLFVDLFRETRSVPCSSSSSNAPPSDFVRRFSSDSSCCLSASTTFDFLLSSGVRDFRTLLPDFVARIIVSLVLARRAAASASSSSSSEATSTQPTHFDLPFFFLGVAFLTAIPFFLADLVVMGIFFAFVVVVVVDIDGLHVAQNHSPGKEAAVTRAHSQWYHLIGQLELSQQIQFSELSGRPQVQV